MVNIELINKLLVKDGDILTHHIATAAANVAKSILASKKNEGAPKPSTLLGAPKTVAEVTAQTAGYKMLEKLQVSYLPASWSLQEITKLMSIFGKVVKIELIMDPILNKFNVMNY